MKLGDKRGLSGVITTLILILLTLVAIGVIWVVVANLIGEGANTINTGQFTLDLVIDEVIVTDTRANVRVTRNSGDGDLTGLKFIISDGTNVKLYRNGILQSDVEPVSSYTIGNNGALYFGRTSAFDGTIDEVMIFDKALTEAQVEDLYNLDLSE